MRLLLAVDSINTLDMLIDATMSRSWPEGTKARVLSVVEDGEVPLDVWRESCYLVDAVRHEMRRRGEQITALAIQRLHEAGIPAEVVIMRGNPEFLIPFEARKWSADLILIRAHNRTDFRNWLLGSVAQSVLGSAPCSVEVVRASVEDPTVVANRRMKILLATDGSESSLAAAREVAEATWPVDTEIKVVSMVNPFVYSLEEIGLCSSRGTDQAHRAIGDAVQVLMDTAFVIAAEVIAGRPAQRIIEESKAWGANLIVVGTRERQGVKRLLFGSISETVANRAHCSVKIVRGRGNSQYGKSLARGQSPSVHRVATVYKLTENLGWKKAA